MVDYHYISSPLYIYNYYHHHDMVTTSTVVFNARAKAGGALGAVSSLVRLKPGPSMVLVCSDLGFYMGLSDWI